MWKMTLSFLMCTFIATLIRVQVAADAAADCATCTSNYKKSATDTDCSKLKTYLDCLETAAGTTEGCTLLAADAQIITDAKCTPPLVSPCTCQKDFWGSDLTGDKECVALKTYIGCLITDATKDTCVSGTLASVLVAKPQGTSESKCTTTGSTTTSTTGSTTPTPAGKKGTTTTPAGQKDSGASSLRMYSAIASFLPFVLAAFRL